MKLNKKFLLLLLSFAYAYTAPKPALPTDASFLYNGAPLAFNQSTKFDVLTLQLLLSSRIQKVAKENENFATYAFRLFFNENGAISSKDIIIEREFANGGFDKKTQSTDAFNTNLLLLTQHCDPENKELCNLLQCMSLDDDATTRKASAQNFYHSEQNILIHVRSAITRELTNLSKKGELQNLCGVALHIYSTKDPCYNCGSSIQYFISTILLQEIKSFVDKISSNAKVISALKEKDKPKHEDIVDQSTQAKIDKNFFVFAIISSSMKYAKAFQQWKRINTEKENDSDYFDIYLADQDVYENQVEIKKISGKSLYMWVPSLHNMKLKETDSGLSLVINNNNSFNNVYQLIAMINSNSCTTKITDLKVKKHIKLSTATIGSALNPLMIAKLTNLTTLNIANTKANSTQLPKMFESLKDLVHINLDGAIKDYEDKTADHTTQPRSELFKAIAKLKHLQTLSAKSNKITDDELCIWLSSKYMKSLTELNAADNLFFVDMEDMEHAKECLIQFMNTLRRSIDLSENGNPPKGFPKIKRLTT